jgi:outer membrane immunogenic protein
MIKGRPRAGPFVWAPVSRRRDRRLNPLENHISAFVRAPMWLLGDCLVRQKPVHFELGLSAVLALRESLRHQMRRAEIGEIAMKKFLLCTVGVVALAAPAAAADLPARTYTKAPAYIAAVYDWSGFYIGANGGWGTSRKCWDRNTGLAGTFLATEGCHDASGGVAGGQIGYRWQSGAWVFGLEAQGDWADLRGSNVSLLNPLVTDRSKIHAFGLFTGQVGYAWNNVLGYLKGGAAVVGDKYTGLSTATGIAFDTAKELRWGGTVGVGLEYGFTPNWSAAIEYDHLFMGTRTRDFALSTNGAFSREDRIRQDADLITARINYRWGGPVIAKY